MKNVCMHIFLFSELFSFFFCSFSDTEFEDRSLFEMFLEPAMYLKCNEKTCSIAGFQLSVPIKVECGSGCVYFSGQENFVIAKA